MENDKHLGLIYKVALDTISKNEICKKYIGVEKEEYVGIGYIALSVAKKNFKSKKNTKFSTFAYKVIKDYFIKYAIRNSTHIKIGNAYKYQAWRIINGKQKTKGNDKIIDRAVKIMKGNQAQIDMRLIEKQEDKQFDWSDIEFLHKNLNEMDDITKTILTMKYGFDNAGRKTINKISQILKMPFHKVRQIERKGIKFLRENMIKVYRIE